jgi:hypothetical protein
MILTTMFVIICQISILCCEKYNHADIVELNGTQLRVRPFVVEKGKLSCIYRILQYNHYVHVFRSLSNVSNLEEYKIKLNMDIGVDQRRYNAPTVS